MKSLYYAGRIYENGEDYTNAILNYNEAQKMVAADDFLYQGLIYSAMGDSYHASFNAEEELLYLQKASDAFEAARTGHISERVERNILVSINKVLQEISGGSEGQVKFEQRINHDLYDIVAKIRTYFPNVSDEDIRFICYLIVGFNTSTISFLMDMTKENVRVKKYRIHKKFEKVDGPNGDLYKIFLKIVTNYNNTNN